MGKIENLFILNNGAFDGVLFSTDNYSIENKLEDCFCVENMRTCTNPKIYVTERKMVSGLEQYILMAMNHLWILLPIID